MPSGTPISVAPITAAKRELERRRQAREDQLQHRHVVDERAAEIARQQPAEEAQILLPQRQIEAVLLDRERADALVGVGRDQHVDRIADGVDADEYQHRDRQHHDEGLQQPLDDESEHDFPLPDSFRSFPRKRESRVSRSGLWVPAFAGTSGRDSRYSHPSRINARVSSTATRHIAIMSSSLRW